MIGDGDSVVLRKGKRLKVVQIKKDRRVRFDTCSFPASALLGVRYGHQFEVEDGKVKAASKDAEDAVTQVMEDNRNLEANDDNQRLTKDEIMQLKDQGVQGEKLIEQIKENSATFESKTQFSQEKWLKKKKARHVHFFTVLPLCSRYIIEMYCAREPQRICNIRVDTISQMLTYSNVHSGCNIMVVENCLGLLVGCLLERMQNYGHVVQFFSTVNPTKQRNALMDFGYSKEYLRKHLKSYPLNEISSLAKVKDEVTRGQWASDENCRFPKPTVAPTPSRRKPRKSKAASAKEEGEAGGESSGEDGRPKGAADGSCSNEDGEDTGPPAKKPKQDNDSGKEDGDEEPDKDGEEESSYLTERKLHHKFIEDNSFDSLVVATRTDPTPVVLALLGYVSPSRPIVIYHQYKEVLMDCYSALRERGGVLNLRLTETWMRDYQVLPQRTHPEVQMSGSGGFLLTGHTTVPDT